MSGIDTTHAADGVERELVVRWRDPRSSLGTAASLSGLEYLRQLLDGRLPSAPIAALMGFTGVEIEQGRVVFRGQPGEQHLSPIGLVHGGFAAALMDSALGCAVHSTLPAGVGYNTIDLTITYVGTITADAGPVLGVAEVVHRGRTIATATGRLIRESDNRLLAHATTTCLILNGQRASR
jgi:uncharacterized protein (TIGR00369 family)